MSRFYFIFLTYSLFIYFLGVFIGRRISLTGLARRLKLDSIKEYADFIYLTVALIFLVFFIPQLWPLTNDDSQILIFSVTAMTLFFQGVIGDRAYKYRNRPKIKVIFDVNETENYHMTVMQSNWLTYSHGILNNFVLAYYVRLRIENVGNTTLKNTQVVLRRVKKGNLSHPFFPLNLTWAFAGEAVDISPKGASKSIDIIEVMEPSKVKQMLIDYEAKGGGPDRDRCFALQTGFRSCSISPNSLSDIFEKGKYLFEILVTAENAEPKLIDLAIDYDGNWKKEYRLDEMKKHLKVKLIS